jgi:hypothetical protein
MTLHTSFNALLANIFLIAVITGIPISQRGGNRIDQRMHLRATLTTSWKGSRSSSGTANPHGYGRSHSLNSLSIKIYSA